jgi:hypothetical protein
VDAFCSSFMLQTVHLILRCRIFFSSFLDALEMFWGSWRWAIVRHDECTTDWAQLARDAFWSWGLRSPSSLSISSRCLHRHHQPAEHPVWSLARAPYPTAIAGGAPALGLRHLCLSQCPLGPGPKNLEHKGLNLNCIHTSQKLVNTLCISVKASPLLFLDVGWVCMAS